MTRALPAALLLTACVPLYPTVREARLGRVVDESGQPVASAVVRVESYQVPTPPGILKQGRLLHELEVRTGRDGTWRVPSEREWTIGFLAADGFPLYVDVYCVFADGYRPEYRNAYQAWIGGPDSAADRILREHDMPAELRLERGTGTAGRPAPAKETSACGVPLQARSNQRVVADAGTDTAGK